MSHVLPGQHVPEGCLEVLPVSSSPLSRLSMVSVMDAVESPPKLLSVRRLLERRDDPPKLLWVSSFALHAPSAIQVARSQDSTPSTGRRQTRTLARRCTSTKTGLQTCRYENVLKPKSGTCYSLVLTAELMILHRGSAFATPS